MIRRAALAGALAATILSSGCLAFITSTQGVALDAEAVASLEKGKTTLPQVLELLGAPHEVHQHADGRVLVYRRRARNTFRLGISPSQILSAVDVSQLASEALGNLRLTIERTHAGEDRLVILLDRGGVVLGVGLRTRTQDLPIF